MESDTPNYIGFVYKWTNVVNGKMYIGLHVGRVDDGYIGSGTLFRKAVDKYGIDSFVREILHFETVSVEALYRAEFDIINKLNAVVSEEYYNISNIDPTTGGWEKVLTDEHKSKISASNKGKMWITNGTKSRKNDPNAPIPDGWWAGNLPCSDLAKTRMSESRKRLQYYTNGIVDIRIDDDIVTPPEGFVRGRSARMPGSGKGMKFFTNGVESKPFNPNDVPSGWIAGRHTQHLDDEDLNDINKLKLERLK